MVGTTLFKIINELSKAEKRYVSLQMNKFTHKKKDYAQLYHVILKMEEYDAGVLKEKLNYLNVKGNLSNLKRYLYDMITDFLCEFYRRESFEGQLLHELERVDILLQKGLQKEGYKLILKLKKMLDKLRHFHPIRLQLHLKSLAIIRNNRYVLYNSQAYQDYFSEQQSIMEAINEEANYVQFHVDFVLKLKNQFSTASEEQRVRLLQEVLENPLLSKPPKAFKSLKAELKYYRTHFEIYKLLVENQKAVFYLKKAKNLIKPFFNKNIQFIDVHRVEFAREKLFFTLQNEDFDVFEKLFHDFNKIITKPKSLKVKCKISTYFHLLRFKEQEKVSHLINWNEIRRDVQCFDKEFKNIACENIIFKCVNLTATKKEYEETLDFFNECMLDIKSPYDLEYYIYCYFVCVVVHCELGNWRFLKSFLLKTERMIVKLKSDTVDKKLIIKFFRKIVSIKLNDLAQGVGVNGDYIQLFKAFNIALSKHNIDYMRKDETAFDLKKWVKTRATTHVAKLERVS